MQMLGLCFNHRHRFCRGCQAIDKRLDAPQLSAGRLARSLLKRRRALIDSPLSKQACTCASCWSPACISRSAARFWCSRHLHNVVISQIRRFVDAMHTSRLWTACCVMLLLSVCLLTSSTCCGAAAGTQRMLRSESISSCFGGSLCNLSCQERLLGVLQLTSNHVLLSCGCCPHDHTTAAVYLKERIVTIHRFPNAGYTTNQSRCLFDSCLSISRCHRHKPAAAHWKAAGACPSAWQVQYTTLHALLLTVFLSLGREFCGYSTLFDSRASRVFSFHLEATFCSKRSSTATRVETLQTPCPKSEPYRMKGDHIQGSRSHQVVPGGRSCSHECNHAENFLRQRGCGPAPAAQAVQEQWLPGVHEGER